MASSSSSRSETENGIQITSDGNYKTQFIEMSAIGSGGFGTVFKVKHKLDDKIYAVKRHKLDDKIYAVKRVQFGENKDKYLKEVKCLAKLNSEYVVQYYNSWLDGNTNELYIQMEYCPQNLRSVLDDKSLTFIKKSSVESMNPFEYYISCEIFKQILESVQYLHESNPPVIHRDLKPDNILIDPNIRSNRIIKLCDFGLATEHNINGHNTSRYGHTSGVGTIAYMAPEVLSGGVYNHLSDIYSLSIIGQKLLGIDLLASQTFEAKDSVIKKPIHCLYKILEKMMSTPRWRQRPECREVLATHNECGLSV
ncbi:unnamed protein product, partial [Medioppia subpectinata]